MAASGSVTAHLVRQLRHKGPDLCLRLSPFALSLGRRRGSRREGEAVGAAREMLRQPRPGQARTAKTLAPNPDGVAAGHPA